MRTPTYVLAVAALFACGDREYIYTPQTANTVAEGMPASRTEIPQEKPQGAVEVTSYGVAQLRQGETRTPVLHVRIVVSNDGDDEPWRIDTRRQFIEIQGEGRSAPIFANGDVQTMPIVLVPRRAQRTLDLFYPLPATMRKEDDLPYFDVLWQVETGVRAVASRTAFDRIEPFYGYDYYYGSSWPYWAGYGAYWHYDPWYPNTFIHNQPVVIRDYSPGVGPYSGNYRPAGPPTVVRRGP
jgi:hypothetical protein